MATKSLKYLGNICGDRFFILRPDTNAKDLIWKQAFLCHGLHDGSNIGGVAVCGEGNTTDCSPQ